MEKRECVFVLCLMTLLVTGSPAFAAGNDPVGFSDGTTVSSLTYGGGVRYMLGADWGLRTAVEGVTVSSLQKGGGKMNYGRVLLGVFWSSR